MNSMTPLNSEFNAGPLRLVFRGVKGPVGGAKKS